MDKSYDLYISTPIWSIRVGVVVKTEQLHGYTSQVRINALYASNPFDSAVQERAPVGLTRYYLCHLLNIIIEDCQLDTGSTIVLEADPSKDNGLVEKVYKRMGFKEHKDIRGFMHTNIGQLMLWCKPDGKHDITPFLKVVTPKNSLSTKFEFRIGSTEWEQLVIFDGIISTSSRGVVPLSRIRVTMLQDIKELVNSQGFAIKEIIS
jgi:hypothetical protein